MKSPWKKIKEYFSSVKSEYSSNSHTDVRYLFGSDSSHITSDNAQKISLVLACVNIKANALCVLPLKTYKKTPTGKSEDNANPLYHLLRYAPNPQLCAAIYKKMISQDIDLRGNHYSQIIRNGLGEVVALYPLVSEKMHVVLDQNGKKLFIYDGKELISQKILHIYDIPDAQGIKGISRIEYAKQTLEFTKYSSMHGNQLFKNSAMPSGSFEMDGELSEEAYKRLKSDLSEKYTGIKNTGTPLLLEGGLRFKPLTLTNSDAEWLESRKFNREEIASIFGVPVAMLNDASNTAYGNLEQKYLEFYSGTIFPLTTIIEEQLSNTLLSEQSKQTSLVKFKYNTMLRVDAQTRAMYYQTRFNIGSISPNEIRAYEDENGFNEGDEYYVQMNLASLKTINTRSINP